MLLVGLGRVIGWGLIIYGGIRLYLGVYVAQTFTDPDSRAAAASAYLGSTTSGEAIDQGVVRILAGIAFLLLARAASRASDTSTED